MRRQLQPKSRKVQRASAEAASIPDASLYRLSLYHCYLGELMRVTDGTVVVRSRDLAEELDIKEETVRRDLSYLGNAGRPGSGYDSHALFDSLQSFLGLKDEYPVVKIGSAQMLQALTVLFPAERYGLRSAAYYSELPEDAGTVIKGLEVRPVSEIAQLDLALEVSVALVACSPAYVQYVLNLLHEAGILGVLLLTPAIKLDVPEGMSLTHVRMPCDIKSLACRCQMPPRPSSE